jgi:uncharacterized protein (TIGR02284 family)
MESNTELRVTLNHLIQICRDGQEGFLTAAENIGHDEAKAVLNEYSLQRAKFTGELQTAAHDLGNSNPENVSTVGGAFHRGWMNIKTAILGRDRHAILSECERGEEVAMVEYKKALQMLLPAPIRETLQDQFEAIRTAHARITALRDAEQPASPSA